jgi:tetratricopeptide (TPR) repeat protein
MPPFGDIIKTDDDLWKIIAWIRSVYCGRRAQQRRHLLVVRTLRLLELPQPRNVAWDVLRQRRDMLQASALRATTAMMRPPVRELWRFISKWARIGARGQEVDCPTTDYAQPTEADCPISEYTEAIQSNPNDVAAYLARGKAYFNASAFDNAINDLTKAIELKPNNESAYVSRGSAHYEKGEFDHAIVDLNKALEINPKSALAYCNLGWTYEAIGDERKAIAHYRKALEIDPSLEAARDNLKLLGATPERQSFHRQTRPRN